MLLGSAICDLIEQRHAVGLGPQPHLSGVAESRVVDLEQLSAVISYLEPNAFEVDPEAMPTIGGDWSGNPVTSLTPNDIKRTADTIDGLVKNDVVLKRIRANHVIIVGVLSPPDQAGRAVPGTGSRLESNLDKAIFDVSVILEKQGIGSLTVV